ncbi:TPA: hypothetical protein ACH3X2_010654 [Trebouxia sp. C0005]
MLGHACWAPTANLALFKHASDAQLHAHSDWSLSSLPPHDAWVTNEMELSRGHASTGDMCKGKKPASESGMQYACQVALLLLVQAGVCPSACKCKLIATVKQVRPPQPPSPPAVVVLGLSHSDHLCAFCTFFARSFTEHYSPDQHVKLVPGDSKQEKAWCVGGLVYTACAVSHSGK